MTAGLIFKSREWLLFKVYKLQEDSGNQTSVSSGPGTESPPWSLMELVVMTFIRCLALLHCYYHLKKVHRVGSSLIMKVILAYYGFTVLLYR